MINCGKFFHNEKKVCSKSLPNKINVVLLRPLKLLIVCGIGDLLLCKVNKYNQLNK